MTQIIRLNREYSPSETCEPVTDQKSGEVILFPGVRYERWDQSSVDGHADKQDSENKVSEALISRDWLEL